MNRKTIHNKLEMNPIIAAIRHSEDRLYLENKEVAVVFILKGSIMTIKDTIDAIRKMDKVVFIHLDFIEGLGKDQKAIEYVSQVLKPDGIISTRSQAIKYAKEQGLLTIQRYFLIDSLSFDTTIHSMKHIRPDFIEVMPGPIPKVITKLNHMSDIPIIAGGLIQDKEDVITTLKAGALGVSTGKVQLWDI